jgi:hypothetical protein
MGTASPRQIHHALEEIVRPFSALMFDHGFKGIKPLAGFHDVGVVGGLRQDIVDLRCHISLQCRWWLVHVLKAPDE